MGCVQISRHGHVPGKLYLQRRVAALQDCEVFFLFLCFFYWSIITLQCCVNFCCTTAWMSYMYTCIPSLPSHPSRSSHSTKMSSLCCTAASHWLSVLLMVACVCQYCCLDSSFVSCSTAHTSRTTPMELPLFLLFLELCPSLKLAGTLQCH